MNKMRHQVLALQNEFVQEHQTQLQLELKKNLNDERWKGSLYEIEEEYQAQVNSNLIVEPTQEEKHIKGKKRWYRNTEIDHKNFVKITSQDKDHHISEKDIQYLCTVLKSCENYRLLDGVINKPLFMIKPIVNLFSDVGNLAEYLPLWTLQTFCYSIENGQLEKILEIISHPPDPINQELLFKRYLDLVSQKSLISRCAAIAICYLTNREWGLPEKVQQILEEMLQQKYSIKSISIHESFVSPREIDNKKIRLRTFKALLTAVNSGCRLNTTLFDIIKSSLFLVEDKPYLYWRLDSKENKTLSGKGEFRKLQSTYKKDALNGKIFSEGDFYYLYQYIICKDKSIDCVWALFYALVGNKQNLPQSGHSEKWNLLETSKKLISFLTLHLKYELNPDHKELQFAAANVLCCIPDFKDSENYLDKSLQIIDRFLKNNNHKDYLEWQNYAVISLYHLAARKVAQSEEALKKLNSHFDSLRVEAINLISEVATLIRTNNLELLDRRNPWKKEQLKNIQKILNVHQQNSLLNQINQ